MNFLIKTYKWFEKIVQPLREWIFENHNNPVLWVVIFAGGVLIFAFAYDKLRKEH